jgi:hypothetical protein
MAAVSVTATLGVLVAVATMCCAGCLIYVHTLPTGYEPLRDAVSDYGVGRYRFWYRAAAATLGAAGLLLAVALSRAVDPAPVGVVVLLVAFGVARLAIVAFPTDLDRSRRTTTGRVHVFLAAVAFVSIAVAAPKLYAAVSGDRSWASDDGALKALAWAIVVGSGATFVAVGPTLRSYFGLIERLLYAFILTWFLVVALHLA